MSAVWMLARGMVRQRPRAWAILVLLAGVGGGTVVAAIAGAVRTDTAYPRFLEAAHAADLVIPFAADGPATVGDPIASRRVLERIARLPMVADSAPALPYQMSGSTDSGTYVSSNSNLQPVAFETDQLGARTDRIKVLEGRLPDPDRPDEAIASLTAAQRDGLRVGSILRLRFIARGPQAAAPTGGALRLVGPEVTVRIVGIEISPLPGDFVYSSSGSTGREAAPMYLTPAFARAHVSNLQNRALAVRLRNGQADEAAFHAQAERITQGVVFFFNLHAQEAVLQGSIHLEAIALGLFATLAGAALVLVMGQAILRQLAVGTVNYPDLRALGATPRQLFLAGVGAAGMVGLAGGLIAAIVAILLSPLTPIGLARTAEPHAGLTADVPILAAGFIALVILLIMFSAYPAWRAAHRWRRDLAGPSPNVSPASRLAEAGARGGLPVTATTGFRLALLPAGQGSSLQTATALGGIVIAIGSVLAAVSFRASLDQLLGTPRLYGWNWDAIVTPQGTGEAPRPSLTGIAAMAEGTVREIGVDGDRVVAFGMNQVAGSPEPVVTEGRAPASTDEILLGSKTAEGKAIGSTVTMRSGEHRRAMTIVGRGVIPVSAENGQLGAGAWMPYGSLEQLVGIGSAPLDTFLVSFALGDSDAVVNRLEAEYGEKSVERPSPPQDLANFGNINQLPAILATVLVIAAVATLSHSLITAIRARRRDLAILKSVGFTRRQVAAAVAWQATTLVALGLVVGLPLGIVAGRWAWQLFASAEGTSAGAVIPAVLLLMAVPGALMLANLVALVPGRLAASTRPAMVFRAE